MKIEPKRNILNKFIKSTIFILIVGFISQNSCLAQSYSKEDIIYLTDEWKGARFDDGRPKVPNGILDRMEKVGIVQAWSVLRGEGYGHQFINGLKQTHPGEVLVGRVLTAQFMPTRPVVEKKLISKGKNEGREGNMIHWPINQLKKGDVYVADIFGKTEWGPVIGDRLGTKILQNSGNGVIMNGAVRDLQGLKKLPDKFASFYRTNHPTYHDETMLSGINIPISIGEVTIMPGDVVLARDEGIIFIPPHLAEKVVETAEIVKLRDKFGKLRLSQGKYSAGEIDGRWSESIEKDFLQWAKANKNKLNLNIQLEELKEQLETRTW